MRKVIEDQMKFGEVVIENIEFCTYPHCQDKKSSGIWCTDARLPGQKFSSLPFFRISPVL